MRARRTLALLSLALAATALAAPPADAKIWFPMSSRDVVVGQQLMLAIPGCAPVRYIALYPGPVRPFLAPGATSRTPRHPVDRAPAAWPPLGRLPASGRLRLVVPAVRPGPYHLAVLATVGTTKLVKRLFDASPAFVISRRGDVVYTSRRWALMSSRRSIS